MPKEARISIRPKCDVCPDPAEYDARIPLYGQWAYLCQAHFDLYKCKLGTGHGQRLIVKEENNAEQNLQAVR